jgi:hypothetical protein
LFKLEIFSKFKFCSNSKFVQIQNLFKFQKKLTFRICLKIKLCSKFEIVQISEKKNVKKEKSGSIPYWTGPCTKLYGRALLVRANGRAIGGPGAIRSRKKRGIAAPPVDGGFAHTSSP